MPRPTTKSKPIIFRVTLAAYETLKQKADAKKMTVNQYTADYIERAAKALQ